MVGQRATVAFLGFPRTGKSTYLGALWQLAQDPAESTIVERDVTGDRSYLQTLGEQVARGEEIDRTELESVEGMQLTLGLESGDVTVHVPDLGGETLRLLVEDRLWHSRLQETLAASHGIVLFLHPEKLRLPMTIQVADEILAGGHSTNQDDRGEAEIDRNRDQSAETKPERFSVAAACTAARCLDALENVLMYQRARWRVRLAIVISAWDTVDGAPTPAHWLTDRVPAVASFLGANVDMVEWSVYGVSAQGGALPTDKDRLLALGSVRKRVFAQGANGEAVPVVEPLRWVLTK